MHIFINDIFIRLVKPGEGSELDEADFNFVVNCEERKITQANLMFHVWLQKITAGDFDYLLSLIEEKVPRNLHSIVATTENYEEVKNRFKSHFKIIKAAGGVVKKGRNVLMIRRLGKWDLPKGKIDKGESTKDAAVREINEECHVEVKTRGKICNTWHTYTMKKKPILKKTTWYRMALLDDTEMAPQTEEDIEDLKWMSPKEVFHALEDSYRSIQFVMDRFYAMKNGSIITK